MSKETRLANKEKERLRQQIESLMARQKTAVNTLAREHYASQISELKVKLQRMN